LVVSAFARYNGIHPFSGAVPVPETTDQQMHPEPGSKLRRAKEKFRLLFELSPFGIAVSDQESGRFIDVNNALLLSSGYTKSEFLNLTLSDFIASAAVPMGKTRSDSTEAPAWFGPEETECLHRDGTRFQVGISGFITTDIDGQRIACTIVRDLSRRRAAENRYAASETRFHTIVNNLPDFIYQLRWMPDETMHFAYVSEGVRMFGVTPDQVTRDANVLLEMIHPDDYERVMQESFDTAKQGIPWRGRFRMNHPDGRLMWVECNDTPQILDDGSILWTGHTSDITEQKKAEQQIQYLAHYDPLTDLPNRTLFFDRLKQALNLARRNQTRLGLLFIDLDKFKPVNDQWGHAIGDLLLQQAGKRLGTCVRTSDTVGRIGGDEFTVLLPEVGSLDNAVAVAEKIHAVLDQPFYIGDQTLSISSSIGIALYPDHGSDIDELTRNADTAMYQAKDNNLKHIHISDSVPGSGTKTTSDAMD